MKYFSAELDVAFIKTMFTQDEIKEIFPDEIFFDAARVGDEMTIMHDISFETIKCVSKETYDAFMERNKK